MIKKLASTLLGLGLGLLTLGVGLSASVTADVAVPITFIDAAASSNCTDCHPAPTDEWHVTNHNMPLSAIPPTPSSCSGCHDLAAEGGPEVAAAHARLSTLRTEIVTIYAEAAPGSVAYSRAQAAETLLSLIEADNRWGFHTPAYIEAQLAEAEALLDTPTAFSQ
ncbi:MAG: hypothetical protein AAF125_02490 [Chloroflexota bacterium]